MPRFRVVATDLFEDDLDAVLSYRLDTTGAASAKDFLDEYDAMCGLLAEFPGYGANVFETQYRWRPLKRFVAVYAVDEERSIVTLLRLFYMSSDWRDRLLEPTPPSEDR